MAKLEFQIGNYINHGHEWSNYISPRWTDENATIVHNDGYKRKIMDDLEGDCPHCGEPMKVEYEYTDYEKDLYEKMGSSIGPNDKKIVRHNPGSRECDGFRLKRLERDVAYLKDFIDNKLKDSEDL